MENVLKNIPQDKQEQYRSKAKYLIDRGYVYEEDVDNLAKKIYNADMNKKHGELYD